MISDDEIRDIFNWQVLHSKKPFENGFPHNGERIYKNVLTLDVTLIEKDKILLEEYAPKLFNTYEDTEKLEEVMIEWATLLHNYRQVGVEKTLIYNMEGEQVVPAYAKKSLDEKTTVLKNRVEDILKLLSTNFATNEHITEFTDILKKVHGNPNKYFTFKPKYQILKQPIKDWLISLKLNGKSKEINDFIKAIK